MQIKMYESKYKNQVISLILYLQNFDNPVNISLEEQPDIKNIPEYYLNHGGGFWIAVNENDDVVGTIGLLIQTSNCGILKKFFVNPLYRGKETGLSNNLYTHLIEYAKMKGICKIILDTPSVCYRAHSFYRKNGFTIITKDKLPIPYEYVDRDSILFVKTLI